MSQPPLDSTENRNRAATTQDLLSRIAGSTGAAGEWWNDATYEELGNRTPTAAWLAGDHEGVKRLVLSWYERSDERAVQARQDDVILEMLEERRRSIAESARRRTA